MNLPVKKYTVGKHVVQLIIEGGKWNVYLDFKLTAMTFAQACEKAWGMTD